MISDSNESYIGICDARIKIMKPSTVGSTEGVTNTNFFFRRGRVNRERIKWSWV